MGGGSKNTADVAKATPFDLRRAVDEAEELGAGGDVEVADETPFCARQHAVGFKADRGVSAPLGMAVVLGPGHPPAVISDGERVGEVAQADAEAMAGCLEFGYVMAGTVSAFDPRAGSGRLVIHGKRKEVT